MNEFFFTELSAWLTQVGLDGTLEPEIVFGFCERCVAAGMPLARGLVAIDTLDPVHEGRVFRWGYNPGLAPMVEYGRTSQEGLAASGFDPQDVEAAQRWRNSAFYHMLQTGASLLRRRLSAATKDEFRVVIRFIRGGNDRLRRRHQPLCRRRGYRRNGRRLLVVGNGDPRRVQR